MFYDKYCELCKQRKISPSAAAIAMGINKGTVSIWKLKGTTPQTPILSKIADYFGVSVDYLLGHETATDAPPDPSVPGSKWIPVVGTIPAGTPVEAVEEVLDYEEISPQMSATGEYFALRIKGQSMEPRIKDGDVVIVRKQDDCDSGDVAVVMVNGNEATVKRVKKEPEGIMLVPNNHAYEPMFYSTEQIEQLPVRIIGKVIELRAKF